MAIFYESLGFCLMPVIVAWAVVYAVMRGMGIRLSSKLQALALVGAHIATSAVAPFLESPLSLGKSFLLAGAFSALLLVAAHKIFGAVPDPEA